MIPVSEITARLSRLVADPPSRAAGVRAANRAAARTNAQLATARLPIRVNVSTDATRARFSYVATGPIPSSYSGVRPADMLRRNLSAELVVAAQEAGQQTRKVLEG